MQHRQVLHLAAQHMGEREAAEIAVLQTRQRFGEDDVAPGAVAVEEHELARRLSRQHRPQMRHDRSDARAAGDRGDRAGRVGRRQGELPRGGHHLDLIAGLELVVDEIGERAPGDPLHRDAHLAIVEA